MSSKQVILTNIRIFYSEFGQIFPTQDLDYHGRVVTEICYHDIQPHLTSEMFYGSEMNMCSKCFM